MATAENATGETDAVKPPAAPKPPAPKLLTKRDLLAKLMADTSLTKRQVQGVLDGLHGAIVEELKSNGVVTVPGLLKLRVVNKAASAERKSINPATRQPMTVQAKPARRSLKSTPLKALKDEVLL